MSSRSLRGIQACDLLTLRLLVAVADRGSVSAASSDCAQSVAASSKRIKEFEQRLDLQLFDRGARGMQPTAAGMPVIAFARSVLGLGEGLARELEHRRSGGSASVALCANASALTQYLPADLTAFAGAHPEVQVQLREAPSGVMVEDIVNARADLGIHDAECLRPGLQSRAYRREKIIVLTPPGHVLARMGRPIRLADVLAHEMVALPPGTAVQAHVSRSAAQLGHQPPMRLQAHSFETACHFVATGLGVSVMPAGVAARWVQQDAAVCLPLDEPWAERLLCMSWSATRALPPPTALFRDFLLARCPVSTKGESRLN